MKFDVIIVGGGIIGVATAHYLTRHDLRIALIEPDVIGAGTTAASMGHLTMLDGNPHELALSQRSLSLWQALQTQLPRTVDYHQCGTLWLAEDDDELAEARRKANFYHDQGINAECIDAMQLRELEPHLATDLCGGVLVPDDAIVYPPLAAKFLFERALEQGLTRIYDRVTALGEKFVLTANQMQYHAEHIIVCAGNETVNLLPQLTMKKKKGQLAITERDAALLHHQTIELGYIKNAHLAEGDSIAANLQPRPTQQLLIGSSRQFNDQSDDINWTLLRSMLKRATRFLPALSQQNILRVWIGFRPTTPDNLPYIGALGASSWVNAGHEGLGIATSLASAELLTQQLLQIPTTLNAAAFSPLRFSAENLIT
jgi:glycine/D-amino acid oxidase-like deaminating enzyme